MFYHLKVASIMDMWWSNFKSIIYLKEKVWHFCCLNCSIASSSLLDATIQVMYTTETQTDVCVSPSYVGYRGKFGFKSGVAYSFFNLLLNKSSIFVFYFKKRKKERSAIIAIIHICMIFPSGGGDSAPHSEFICQTYLTVTGLSFLLRQICYWTPSEWI